MDKRIIESRGDFLADPGRKKALKLTPVEAPAAEKSTIPVPKKRFHPLMNTSRFGSGALVAPRGRPLGRGKKRQRYGHCAQQANGSISGGPAGHGIP